MGFAASVLRDTGRQGSGTAFVLRSVPLNWCLILGRMRLSARFCLSVSRCVLHSRPVRAEEHTSELKSLMRISNDVLCLKKNTTNDTTANTRHFIVSVHRRHSKVHG